MLDVTSVPGEIVNPPKMGPDEAQKQRGRGRQTEVLVQTSYDIWQVAYFVKAGQLRDRMGCDSRVNLGVKLSHTGDHRPWRK